MGPMTMPPRIRPPRRRRLTLPVVFYAHPFELALGAALVINGVRGIVGDNTPSVDALPPLPRLLYLAVSTIGGLGVVIGLWTHRKAVERASLFLVAAAYATVGILIVATNGTNGIATATVAAVVGAACVLRAIAIRRAALIVLATLTEARRDEEAQP